MTRARDQLHLMPPQRFFTHGQRSVGDRHVYAQRTRFIPAAITKHFESLTWQPSIVRDAKPAPARKPVDLQSHMRRMWK
jgi:DNA helicase-2/ATP-dependent DNA helicase PcrA